MKPIDVNIYILNLEEGNEPRIEKMPGQIIDDGSDYTPLIHYIGSNDFKVWYDDFDDCRIGRVHMPLRNIIELVAERDMSDEEAIRRIATFCRAELNRLYRNVSLFEKGISVAASELAAIYKEETENELKQN